jgi:hypothetical protein
MTTYFCDGLKEVAIVNGVARLEFHRLEPTGLGAQGREMRTITEMTIALPVNGFVQALGVLEKVRDQLVKEGVLKPTPQPEEPPRVLKSPNFA